MSESPNVARRFAIGLALLVSLAFALRVWALERCGIDHYDEGVYAFSAAALAAPQDFPELYPGQEKFSPPLYFGAAGLLARVGGLEIDTALVALNALLGAATVALLALVGRRWFGPAAGLASGALLALNEYHIALSRSALTDVAFALAHLGAWFALIEALRAERLGRALAAGVLVAVAWNVKYHGWLAVVASALAFAPIFVARLATGRPWRGPLLLGCAAAGVAALGYLPWALHIQAQPGGYAALAQYQSTMLRGGWFENLARQGAQQLFFEGPLSAAAPPLALACALWLSPARAGVAVALAALLGALACAFGGAVAFTALAACALLPLVPRARALEWPALALLAALTLWSLLTPFYHPYARLLLPLVLLALLAAGLALESFARRFAEGSRPSSPRAALLALGVALATSAASRLREDPSDPWRDARGIERAAEELTRSLPRGARVFVLGDPALAWYLRRAGVEPCEVLTGPECLERLEREPRETFIACGFYPRLTGAEARLVESAGARLALHATAEAQVKDVRLLDDFRVSRALRLRREPGDDYQVRLHRYAP